MQGLLDGAWLVNVETSRKDGDVQQEQQWVRGQPGVQERGKRHKDQGKRDGKGWRGAGPRAGLAWAGGS